METWNKVALSEICDLIAGFAFKSKDFGDYDSKVIKITHITPPSVDMDNVSGVDISKYNAAKLEKYIAQTGDYVLAMTGATIGKIGRIEHGRAYINQRVLLFKPRQSVDKEYLYYALQQYEFAQYITNHVDSESAQPNISAGTIGKYQITLPPIEIQRRIGTLLRAYDEKRENNRKINDHLQQQAATVFGMWLSKCTGSTSIGELSNNILDYTPITNEMVRLLNSSDVTEGVFPVAPLVQNKDLKGHFKKRFQFEDILYSEIRPRNHHYGYVLFNASEYIASTRLMVIRAIPSKLSPALLYQYLLLPEVEAEFTLKTESRSGTFPQGNYADMASIVVPYSSIESQSEVSAILSQIRKTVAQNQLENQRLEELRDTLLPRLMSGEIDVSDILL